jgi:hypothetical protein
MRAKVLWGLGALLLAAGMFVAGRSTVDTGAARSQGYAAGQAAGEADGLRLGRALQAAPVPGTARDAYQAGYAAGANDVFAGYDGGWDTCSPYVIVLVPGDNGVTYRIASRAKAPAGNYYRCR